jgi:hypothetical protein
VNFWDFRYEFNSLIELNDFGGNIVIKNSLFDNFQTCSAIIRNKKVAINKSGLYTPANANDFYTYFVERANRMLYEELQKK